jgi:hypothetical protein
MTPTEALDALGQVFGVPSAQVGLAKPDLRRPVGVPYRFLAELNVEDESSARVADLAELTRLAIEDPEAALPELLTALLDRVAPLLGISVSEQAALRPGFGRKRLNELGFDSLTTVQLRSRLMIDFGVSVPTDQLYGATAADVAGLLCRHLALRSVLFDGPADDADLGEDMEVMTL